MTRHRAPRTLFDVSPWLFIALVWFVAAGTVAFALVREGPPREWGALSVLAVLGALSRAGRRGLLRTEVGLSLSSVVQLTAIPLVGPVGAAIVAAVSVLSQLGRVRLQAAVYNSAMYTAMGALGGLAYFAAGGALSPTTLGTPNELIFHVAIPLLVADLVQCITNAVLLAGILRVATGAPFGARLRFLLSSSGAAYVGYGLLSFLLVVLWGPAGVGPISTLLLVAPLLVARWALGQYGAEVEAHNRTLTALVSAIEIKSPSLAGHSDAVSRVCDWIGDELHLPTPDVEAVRTAGMLHDIGLLGLPSELLRPTHVLTPAEMATVEEHTTSAARMLDGISFLDRAVIGVVHHHERFDGTGYPAGLAGERIPLIARVVGTADAFVALLAGRIDRPALTPGEALDVLQDLTRSSYDPAVVSALGRALSRHEAPTLPVADVPGALGSAVAHDEPGLGSPRPTIHDAAHARPKAVHQ